MDPFVGRRRKRDAYKCERMAGVRSCCASGADKTIPDGFVRPLFFGASAAASFSSFPLTDPLRRRGWGVARRDWSARSLLLVVEDRRLPEAVKEDRRVLPRRGARWGSWDSPLPFLR